MITKTFQFTKPTTKMLPQNTNLGCQPFPSANTHLALRPCRCWHRLRGFWGYRNGFLSHLMKTNKLLRPGKTTIDLLWWWRHSPRPFSSSPFAADDAAAWELQPRRPRKEVVIGVHRQKLPRVFIGGRIDSEGKVAVLKRGTDRWRSAQN